MASSRILELELPRALSTIIRDMIINTVRPDAENHMNTNNTNVIIYKLIDNDEEYVYVSRRYATYRLFEAVKNSSVIEKYYRDITKVGDFKGESVEFTFKSYTDLVSYYHDKNTRIIEKEIRKSPNIIKGPNALSMFEEHLRNKEDPIDRIVKQFGGKRSEAGNVAVFPCDTFQEAFNALSEISGCILSDNVSFEYDTQLIIGLRTPKSVDHSVEKKAPR